MTGRAVVYGMLALAAIVCTSHGELTWTRLGIGFTVYLVVNIGAGVVGARYANRQ